MKHLKKFEGFGKYSKRNKEKECDPIVIDIVNWIKPANMEDSGEPSLREYGDDSDIFGHWRGDSSNPPIDEQIKTIEEFIFTEDSEASEKFGFDVLQKNKSDILELCRKYIHTGKFIQ